MKKLFLVLAAAFAMVACQTDINEVGVVGGEVDVTFEVGTPTRAYSDGTTATVLQYAVYEVVDKDNEGTAEILTPLTVTNGEIHGSTTVKLQLVTGNTYAVVFWAAAEGAPYDVNFGGTLGEATMTVDYTNALSNDEKRDAFFKKHVFTVKGAQTETIELRRPFAQLNIGTNDYDASANAGYIPVNSYVEVAVHNTLKLATGEVDGQATQKFNYAAINKDETFPVAAEAGKPAYKYLAMNYLLVDADKETVDVVFGYSEGDAAVAKTRTVGSVPVQRNYRTNIYGQLLTSDVDINVVIKPEYYEPAHTADALYLAAAVGGEVTLTEDVVLTSALNVQSNMTINLNGHNITIDAAYDSVNYEASSAIVNNAVLTLTGNGEISATNNYTVRNNGTMVIDGVTVKNGIMNFGELTVESGNISNSRSGKHTIYGNAAKLTINGGTFHNENAGNAGIYAYGGEVVINGGEFTIADGTATQGWTSCLLDAQGGAKYTINGGVVRGEIRDYNKNTTVYGGVFGHNSVKNFLAAGYKAIEKDGLYYVVADTVEEVLTEAVVNREGKTYSGEVFVNPINNALHINNAVLLGDATIKVENKTYGAIIIENVSGDLNGNVIEINNDNNSVMVLQNCDFTLAEGKKLITSTKPIYQVFMANITINGEKMTQATIAQYLENVAWYQVVEEI